VLTDRNGLEVLERDECLRLLAGATIGRVGLSSQALPVVLPVNFVLDGTGIVIRTAGGSKLDAAIRNAVVAFEVDAIEPFTHTGWSVLVTGVAVEVTDPDQLARIRRLPLAHWAPGPAEHFVRISTNLVSGRRLGPVVAGGRMAG
jgi:uncharacterized protein